MNGREGRPQAIQEVSNRPRTVSEVLTLASRYLAEQGIDTARLDAEVLLANVLGCGRIDLYVNHDRPMEPVELDLYRRAVAKRARRVPVAYITGEKEFMSLTFAVTGCVLVPRPETEILVEKIIEGYRLKSSSSPGEWRMVDLGTGSGIIAVTVAKNLPEVTVDAVDISPKALEVARENAVRHGVIDRINFIQSDLFSAIPESQTYHIIASNPPYIARRDFSSLEPEVLLEPRQALDGGPTGLEFYHRIALAAAGRLVPGGFGALEIGCDQAKAVREILVRHGFTTVDICEDYAGKDRVVLFEF